LATEVLLWRKRWVAFLWVGENGCGDIRTLLPLIKRSIQIILAVIAFTIILSALDVKSGPALASVGVVGFAVGFGSQALVRDILSGVFFCSKMPSGSENNSI
jgi:small-conductance mechanosensitive channel